jgi:hypothetical protein
MSSSCRKKPKNQRKVAMSYMDEDDVEDLRSLPTGRGNSQTDFQGDEENGELDGREDLFAVIDAFFESHSLVHQQIESFNQFIEQSVVELLKDSDEIHLVTGGQETITVGGETKVVHTRHTIRWDVEQANSLIWRQPTIKQTDEDGHSSTKRIYPAEARYRGLTYAAKLEARLQYTCTDYCSIDDGKLIDHNGDECVPTYQGSEMVDVCEVACLVYLHASPCRCFAPSHCSCGPTGCRFR